MGIDSQTITVIVSILVPTLSGFVWIIHRMDKQFEKVEVRFKEMQVQVDARFEKVDARFEKVDKRFEKVDAQFKEVGAQISNIGDRLVGMEKQLNAVDLRTGFIEKLLDIFRMSQIPPKEKKITE
jgi:hypothetical protein